MGSAPPTAVTDLSPLAREIKKRRPFAVPAEEAYLNLVRTQSWLSAECERMFKRFGLSSPSTTSCASSAGRPTPARLARWGCPAWRSPPA